MPALTCNRRARRRSERRWWAHCLLCCFSKQGRVAFWPSRATGIYVTARGLQQSVNYRSVQRITSMVVNVSASVPGDVRCARTHCVLSLSTSASSVASSVVRRYTAALHVTLTQARSRCSLALHSFVLTWLIRGCVSR